jgi:hypothetical protein
VHLDNDLAKKTESGLGTWITFYIYSLIVHETPQDAELRVGDHSPTRITPK